MVIVKLFGFTVKHIAHEIKCCVHTLFIYKICRTFLLKKFFVILCSLLFVLTWSEQRSLNGIVENCGKAYFI